jgi:hypothetical protein
LQPNNANSIRNGLETITPDERFQLYIEVQKTAEPDDIRLFETIFRGEYPLEFKLAKIRLLDMVAETGAFPTGMGGKTRRNRRRGRRGRRSLKHYSKRR